MNYERIETKVTISHFDGPPTNPRKTKTCILCEQELATAPFTVIHTKKTDIDIHDQCWNGLAEMVQSMQTDEGTGEEVRMN